jgi:cap2 methyltransferase
VKLVTADGSVDSQNNPNEQESIVGPLHYCEIVCALGCLAIGGSLILKKFTLYEHLSLAEMYLLRCLFKSLIVCKPATSKAGNSEVYIVGIHYKGIPSEYLVKMLEYCEEVPKDLALIHRKDIPSSFVDEVHQLIIRVTLLHMLILLVCSMF